MSIVRFDTTIIVLTNGDVDLTGANPAPAISEVVREVLDRSIAGLAHVGNSARVQSHCGYTPERAM